MNYVENPSRTASRREGGALWPWPGWLYDDRIKTVLCIYSKQCVNAETYTAIIYQRYALTPASCFFTCLVLHLRSTPPQYAGALAIINAVMRAHVLIRVVDAGSIAE
jgi:hypothetical protein